MNYNTLAIINMYCSCKGASFVDNKIQIFRKFHCEYPNLKSFYFIIFIAFLKTMLDGLVMLKVNKCKLFSTYFVVKL